VSPGINPLCVSDSFDPFSLHTIGVDFLSKDILVRGSVYQLEIWDTAGQEQFRAITESYFRDAAGAIIVYDVNDQTTFESVPEWFASLRRRTGTGVPVILVGNKDDLPHTVDEARAMHWADEHDIPHFFASAKDGTNIDAIFNELAQRMISIRQTGATDRMATTISVLTPQASNARRGCCR
jgi:small GTP-binding protein